MKRDVANIKKKTIEKNRYIKYSYPYKIEIAEKIFEIKLVYSEKDGTLDGIVYDRKMHKLLMHILRDFSQYNIPLTVSEYRKTNPETRILNIMFNKAGGNASKNSISNKISIPSKWVKEMGLTKTNRSVKVTYDGDKIIIEKK